MGYSDFETIIFSDEVKIFAKNIRNIKIMIYFFTKQDSDNYLNPY